MKQFLFMILCALTAIGLSAQDAQIYRKGSSGYVLSVPYTRTKDNEAKPRDDKRKDDKQDSAAKEKAAKEKEEVVVMEDKQAQTAAEQDSPEVVIEEKKENIDEGIVEAEEEAAESKPKEEAAAPEEEIPEEEIVEEEIVETEDELAVEEEVFEEEVNELIEEEEAAPKEPPVKVIEPPRREALEIDGSETVKTATVEEIKNNTKHYSNVILEGEMTLQLGDRAFILTDPTGTLKVELTREAEFYIGDAVLLGSTVRVLGVVKKRVWDDVVIEALKVKVIVPTNITGDLQPVLSDENETEEIMADEIENSETEDQP